MGNLLSTSPSYIFSSPVLALLHVGRSLMVDSTLECSWNGPDFIWGQAKRLREKAAQANAHSHLGDELDHAKVHVVVSVLLDGVLIQHGARGELGLAAYMVYTETNRTWEWSRT